MTRKEFTEAMETRPALVEIDKILGNSVSPIKKMEVFWYIQKLTGETIRRVWQDLNIINREANNLTKPKT